MIEVHVLAEDGPLIDALVIYSNLVVGNVVVHDHLTRTHGAYLSNLLRNEPAYMNNANDLIQLNNAEEHNIDDSALNEVHANAVDGKRCHIAYPILNDTDMMRSEVT